MDELTKDPMKHNLELLFGVLSENKDTEYGRKYKFSEIHTLTDYKANVDICVNPDGQLSQKGLTHKD